MDPNILSKYAAFYLAVLAFGVCALSATSPRFATDGEDQNEEEKDGESEVQNIP